MVQFKLDKNSHPVEAYTYGNVLNITNTMSGIISSTDDSILRMVAKAESYVTIGAGSPLVAGGSDTLILAGTTEFIKVPKNYYIASSGGAINLTKVD